MIVCIDLRSEQGYGTRPDDSYLVGESVTMDVEEVVRERAIIRDPEGRRLVLEPAGGEITFVPQRPGTYTFFADDDGDDTGQAVEALTLSANVDRDGSELGAFPHAVLADWGGEREGGELIDGAGDERRINLWSKFLFFVALALLAETVIGVRRSVLVRTWERIAVWR